jgi:hypothetical protein
MVEPEHHNLEVPEADEIEQHTSLVDTDTEAPVTPSLPNEAAEGDALEQNMSIEPEDEYPPA